MISLRHTIETGITFATISATAGGEIVVVRARDRVACFEVRNGKPFRRWVLNDCGPVCCEIANENSLLCCLQQGPLLRLDLNTGQTINEISPADASKLRPIEVLDISLSHSRQVALVQANRPSGSYFLDLAMDEFVWKLPGPWGGAQFHPSDRLIIQKSLDSYQFLALSEYHVSEWQFLKPAFLLDESVLSFGFSSCGDWLALVTAPSDDVIRLVILSFPGLEVLAEIPLNQLALPTTREILGNEENITIYPSETICIGETVLLASSCGTLLQMDRSTSATVSEGRFHSAPISDMVKLNNDGVMTVDVSGNIAVWSILHQGHNASPVGFASWQNTDWYRQAMADSRPHFRSTFVIREHQMR